jgi:hypothetical protein
MAAATAEAVCEELNMAAATVRAAKAEAARIKEAADAARCTADAADAKRQLFVVVEAAIPLLMRHIIRPHTPGSTPTQRSQPPRQAPLRRAPRRCTGSGAASRWACVRSRSR